MARIWFITGSSRGLGRALTQAVLDAGDSVAATARRPEQLQSFVDEYGAERVLALALDVTDEAQVNQAVGKAQAAFGRIDVVVNNAGYAETAALEDATTESFRHQIDANFLGVVYVTKAVVPIMRKQEPLALPDGRRGHILQVSSLGGRMGSPGLSAYQSAKWAVGGFSTALSAEVAPLGIRITVLEPGGMATDWAGSSMGITPISEPYQQTVGAFKTMLDGLQEAGPTDPGAIARAVVHVSRADDPPLRLLLGADTPDYARMAADALAQSDAKWHKVTILEGL